jgi:hypothetical protein
LAACAVCPHRDAYIPTSWFTHIWFLHTLQRAGFPFRQDDLSIDEWMGLAELKAELEAFSPNGK